jgi:hypothetical protein
LIAVTPAHAGGEPRCCGAQSERGGRHKADDDTGRSRTPRGFLCLSDNFSHAAIRFRRFKSGSGGDQSYQICSVIICELASRAFH